MVGKNFEVTKFLFSISTSHIFFINFYANVKLTCQATASQTHRSIHQQVQNSENYLQPLWSHPDGNWKSRSLQSQVHILEKIKSRWLSEEDMGRYQGRCRRVHQKTSFGRFLHIFIREDSKRDRGIPSII